MRKNKTVVESQAALPSPVLDALTLMGVQAGIVSINLFIKNSSHNASVNHTLLLLADAIYISNGIAPAQHN